MNYPEKLRRSAAAARSIFCLGIDPMLEYFPADLRPTGTLRDIGEINTLVHTVLDAMEERGICPAAFKPNIGYFSACDRPLAFELSPEERFAGSMALAEVIRILRKRMPRVPLILDSKRGDIARSSTNYAQEAFHGWGADAVTVSPWMGDDTVAPFRATGGAGRGIYLLVRTSNPGAARFQNAVAPDRPMYRRVLETAREWAEEGRAEGYAEGGAEGGSVGGTPPAGATLGAVVGATAPAELAEITAWLREFPMPLLIPGVGRQGGTAEEVLRVLKETSYPPELVRVNISSGALFPWIGGAAAPANWKAALGEAVLRAWSDLAITPSAGAGP